MFSHKSILSRLSLVKEVKKDICVFSSPKRHGLLGEDGPLIIVAFSMAKDTVFLATQAEKLSDNDEFAYYTHNFSPEKATFTMVPKNVLFTDL